jgi:hypothetical protein
MKDQVEFELGEIVFRKTEPEISGMVTGILFRPNGIMYYCKFSTEDENQFYNVELIRDKVTS